MWKIHKLRSHGIIAQLYLFSLLRRCAKNNFNESGLLDLILSVQCDILLS